VLQDVVQSKQLGRKVKHSFAVEVLPAPCKVMLSDHPEVCILGRSFVELPMKQLLDYFNVFFFRWGKPCYLASIIYHLIREVTMEVSFNHLAESSF
jgi:hypothetical protein